MQEIIGKTKTKPRNLPPRIFIMEKELYNKKITEKQLTEYCINIGTNLGSNVDDELHKTVF